MSILSKYKTTVVVCGALLGGSVVLLAATAFHMIEADRELKRRDAATETLRNYYQVYGPVPTEAVARKQRISEYLKKKYEEQRAGLPQLQSAQITPLQFKERLFAVNKQMQALAERKNARIPEYLGFNAFVLDVPDERAVPHLYTQLLAAEELARWAIESDVRIISAVGLSNAEPAEKSKKKEGPAPSAKTGSAPLPFKTETITLSLECDSAALRKFLTLLASEKSMYVVDVLKVASAKTESMFAVDCTIQYVEL